MTTELTLREKVADELLNRIEDRHDANDAIDRIASLLSATGATAYIRVAQDLRGEWVEGERVG